MSSIVLVEQSSAPTTPATGKVAVFVDTNGDLSWKDDAGNVVKIAAAGSYTLTIPASGTAALRDVAQTFSAQQTFSQAPIAPGMKPAADSTTAIQLMNAAGTPVLTVDTTNGKVDVDALQIGGVDVPYAKSTWTPALNFGGATTGITYTTQTGNYVRMGNLIYVNFSITLSSKGSATGAATITGLPFAAGGVAPGMNIRYYANLASIVGSAFSWIGTSTINLVQMGSATPSSLTDANFANNSRLDMWGVYSV